MNWFCVWNKPTNSTTQPCFIVSFEDSIKKKQLQLIKLRTTYNIILEINESVDNGLYNEITPNSSYVQISEILNIY